ncbi:response regulator transcription factor [Dehalobacter restrictus]|uniref:response regulator transcription factor n=1 Tax=Dehalobacter restrictus TaxID=55583 RepID=UPI00338EE39F
MTSEETKKFKIAILDDEPMWCDAIVGLLKREPSLSVVGVVATQAKAVDLAARYAPDIFLVDMMLKHRWQTGVSATIAIREASPLTKIIILTSSEKEEEVVQAVSAGAYDYLSKNNCEDLLPMVLRYLRGGFSPRGIIANDYTKLRQEQTAQVLTEQERLIIEAISQNVPRSQLAKLMYKSESTIKTQISSILKKLDVSNISEAMEKIKHGGVFFPQMKNNTRK